MQSIDAEVDAASSRVLGKTKTAGSRFYFAIRQLTLTAVSRSFRALFQPVMKTFSAKANEVSRQWWLIDAKDQVLGQVAVRAANLLRGKEKPIFTPHVDTGDFVVVINAEKVRVTGKKEESKTYMSFSGYVGGHKSENVQARRVRHPELLIERAVRGMIPHNRLGRAVYRKLKVYRGDSHPHAAQQPQPVTLA
jgi:large subunit ribosomal protein L13